MYVGSQKATKAQSIEADSNLDGGTKRSILFNVMIPDCLVLTSYPTAFNLIFDQLITNSWDHYPATQQQDLEINIHIKQSNDGISIVFSDNGAGLASDEIDAYSCAIESMNSTMSESNNNARSAFTALGVSDIIRYRKQR